MQLVPRLLDSKSVQIKAIARLCGSKISGSKPMLATELEATVAARTQGSDRPYRSVSVDLGIKNLGICQLLIPPQSADAKTKPLVEKWFHHSSPQPLPHKFPEFSDEAITFANMLKADAFVLEKQRSRTAGSRAIPNDVLRVNVMEGMAFTALRLQHPKAVSQSVSPRDVVDFWRSEASNHGEIPQKTVNLTQGQAYRIAKRTRAALVKTWLASPDESPVEFKHEPHPDYPKHDDINDALVQAYTWALWRRNCTQLVVNLKTNADLIENSEEPAAVFRRKH